MQPRRIVTGLDAAGKSIFLDDQPTPKTTQFSSVKGFVTSLVWGTKPGDGAITKLEDPTAGNPSWLPVAGGTWLQIVTFPPDSVMMSPDFDPMAAGGEYVANLPGLAERFEQENPGMHQTDTVDYGIVLEGEIVLELDDGATRALRKNDVVVQNGTRHAWRNPYDKPVTMAFVLVDTRS